MGIRRINEAYKKHEIKPIYTILDQSITIEFPIKTAQYKITNDASKIIDALRGGLLLSSSEIAEATGFNKSKVLRLMKNLIDNKYITVSGGGRSTRYQLR